MGLSLTILPILDVYCLKLVVQCLPISNLVSLLSKGTLTVCVLFNNCCSCVIKSRIHFLFYILEYTSLSGYVINWIIIMILVLFSVHTLAIEMVNWTYLIFSCWWNNLLPLSIRYGLERLKSILILILSMGTLNFESLLAASDLKH